MYIAKDRWRHIAWWQKTFDGIELATSSKPPRPLPAHPILPTSMQPHRWSHLPSQPLASPSPPWNRPSAQRGPSDCPCRRQFEPLYFNCMSLNWLCQKEIHTKRQHMHTWHHYSKRHFWPWALEASSQRRCCALEPMCWPVTAQTSWCPNPNWIAIDWIDLKWVELARVGLSRVEINVIGLGWICVWVDCIENLGMQACCI